MQYELNGDMASPLMNDIQTYRVPRRDRIAGGIVSFLGAGFALLVAYALVFGVQMSADNRVINVVYTLVFPIPLACLGLLLLRRFAELCALSATVTDYGISVRTLKDERATTWRDVSSLDVDFRRPPSLVTILVVACFCWFLVVIYLLNTINPRLRYALRLKYGDAIPLPRALLRTGMLLDRITITLVRTKLPDALERFRSGIPSAFGPFSVEADGLHWRKIVLPWHELYAVMRSPSSVRIFRTGRKQPWVEQSLREVPNAALFTALLSTILEVS